MKTTFHRRLMIGILLMIGARIFAAGQDENETTERTNRPYAGVTLNALMEGHPTTDALRQMLPRFERETGIRVNMEVIPYSDMTAKSYLVLSQESDEYDVYFNDWANAVGLVDAGHLAALDDAIADERLNRFVDIDDFVPTYANQPFYNGSRYGLPMYGESTFLMYRKDLFAEYGVEVPETFSELLAAARTIHEATDGDVYGITLRGQQGIHAVYAWAAFLWGAGGSWFDRTGRLSLDSAEAIAGTQFYADILNRYGPPGFANFGWTENRVAFTQGRAAMTIDAPVNGAFNEDERESAIAGLVGYAPVPVADGAELIGGQHSLAVHHLYVSRYSKAQEAAFLFISWATSKEVQARGFTIEPHSGVTSVSALDSDAFQDRYGAFVPGMLAALEQANQNYLPQVPESNEIINLTGIALSRVLSNQSSAREALTEVTREINRNVLQDR